MFQNLILSSSERPRRSRRSLLYSLLVHVVLAGGLLTLPVLFHDQLKRSDFVSYVMATPVLPHPPSPLETRPPSPHHRPSNPRISQGSTVVINHPLPEIQSEIVAPEADVIRIPPSWLSPPGEGTRVPGPPPGIGMGGGEYSTYELNLPDSPPPPPPPRIQEPLKVHGGIQASKVVDKIIPIYPQLAKQARIQGSVLLGAVIGEDGRVTHLEVLRGHPLLRQAAFDAVRRWRYSPTLLSGKPVQVATTITVVFRLR